MFLGGFLTRLPAKVPGDGNCFFHALSIAIAGDTSLTTELRVRTCIEMVTNRNSYVKKHKDSGIKFVSPDYLEAVKDCSRDGVYSSAWTIDAAATVMERKIRSIYPPVNGLLDRQNSFYFEHDLHAEPRLLPDTTYFPYVDQYFTSQTRNYMDSKSLPSTLNQKTTPGHRHYRRREYGRGIVHVYNKFIMKL